jgi:hypothetical protein
MEVGTVRGMATAKKSTESMTQGEWVDPTAEVWDREVDRAKEAEADEAKAEKAADKADKA